MALVMGFAGLGVMGMPMAKRVQSKYGVVAFDVDPAKMAEFPDRAESIADLGSRSNVVLLSLPTSAIVRETILGRNGLADNLARGSVIIDMSTTEPAVIEELAEALEARGLSLLDAPVSGGELGAIQGTLSFMVGGRKDIFERCLDILKTMGSSVVLVGSSGQGQVAKLVNNLIVGITFAAVAEGFVLGTKSGLRPEVLYEAIRGGWAGSKVLDVSVPAMLKRDFKPGGTVDIHWKDLGYALAQAKEKDVPVPVTALVHEIFKAARASGRGKLSQPAIVQLWEELLHIEVR